MSGGRGGDGVVLGSVGCERGSEEGSLSGGTLEREKTDGGVGSGFWIFDEVGEVDLVTLSGEEVLEAWIDALVFEEVGVESGGVLWEER